MNFSHWNTTGTDVNLSQNSSSVTSLSAGGNGIVTAVFDPEGSHSGAANFGGLQDLLWVTIGGALVVAGGVAVIVRRRRTSRRQIGSREQPIDDGRT